MVAVTTIEMIDGKKKAERKNCSPFLRLLIKIASAKANRVVTGVVPITKIKVFFSACKN